jgi:hypothetical protein
MGVTRRRPSGELWFLRIGWVAEDVDSAALLDTHVSVVSPAIVGNSSPA